MQQLYAANTVQKKGPAASTLPMCLPRSLVRNPGVKIFHLFRPCSSNRTALLSFPLGMGTNSSLQPYLFKRF
ncbi:hypothetical protein MTR67_048586 [Solanum verrucosum]|uniref:Uncharacterized protein n=1 Tax=Solanum verrucosum TaxID=315347 RepID=A0AAF0ZXJ5_SOLVR|nr:hypothetical protein MTR67_048586 [Solanum verrucosum]